MKYLKKFNEDFTLINNHEEMEGVDAHKNCENCEKPTYFCDCEENLEEITEKKKIPAGLQAYLDKKAGKKAKKADDKDVDKSAKKDKKADEKAVKGKAAQKKLPAGLQKAILAKKK